MVIFKDSQDNEVFLGLLRKAQILFHFQIFAYSLMTNHYHLLFKDNKKQLPRVIGWLQQNYSIYYNAKYNHSGAVFMRPFKSKPIYNKVHFFNELCYIQNNPVKAKIVTEYSKYKWNSPLGGYEKYNLTDYLYLHFYYKPIAGLSLSEYIKHRSRSKKISNFEIEALSDKDAKVLFNKTIKDFSEHNYSSFDEMPKSIQNEIIMELQYQGINARQLSDLTGKSKTSILRMKSKRPYL